MKLPLKVLFLCLVCNYAHASISPQLPEVRLHQLNLVESGRHIPVTLAVFNDQEFQIQVVDNRGANDEPRYPNLAQAMMAGGYAAGCNGGFFNRKPFDPVGAMISAGQRINPVDPDSWMKGLLVVRNGHPSLEATESFGDRPEISDLLQSGTWLVRARQSEKDSSRTQLARRTFICCDGNGAWAIGACERCTLYELAEMLKSTEVTTIIDIQEALNFDGGPSTGLWVKASPSNFWFQENWPVRNYVGIKARISQ